MTPRERLLFSRVVDDPGVALSAALDRDLTGQVAVAPGDTVLLGDEGELVLGVDGGVPVRAVHTGTGRGGPNAVADLGLGGPYRVELYDGDPGTRGDPVAPGVPAEVLAADPDLAERTRAAAPEDGPDPAGATADAVTAFLENGEKIAAIREQAREEASRRAAEWGFDDLLAE